MGNKLPKNNFQSSTNQSTDENNSNINKNEYKEKKNIADIIDYVATHYILTMNFESLTNLHNKTYCDKLIVLTSDIINKNFTDREVSYLSNKINKTEHLIYTQQDDLDLVEDVEPNKKHDLCNGIAKFYINIAHIFACIMTTVNPIYVFKNYNGEILKVGLNEKNKIPFGVKPEIIKYNICDNRISSLKNDFSENEENDSITIHPTICNVNLDVNGELKTLQDEPGIPELIELYNDANYDYETGEFNGMSVETEKLFKENLKEFYTTFTGNENMPPEIKQFSDVKLRDYNKNGKCMSSFNSPITGTNDLFKQYANNIQQMILKTNKNRDELLGILNKLFVYFVDTSTGAKIIRINPDLDETKLQTIVVDTRNIIIKLYLNCEQDYVNGIKLYEAIVEQKILETSQNQINSLKQMSQNLLSTDVPPLPTEPINIDTTEHQITAPTETINAPDMGQNVASTDANMPEISPQIGAPTETNSNQTLTPSVPPPEHNIAETSIPNVAPTETIDATPNVVNLPAISQQIGTPIETINAPNVKQNATPNDVNLPANSPQIGTPTETMNMPSVGQNMPVDGQKIPLKLGTQLPPSESANTLQINTQQKIN